MKQLSILLSLAALFWGACTPGNKVGGDTDTNPQVLIPLAIDLGLSVKWASFNLGATTPQESGFYYAWGEGAPKNDTLMGV